MSRNIYKRSNRTGTTSSDILRDPINTLAQLRAYPVTDTLDKTLVYVKEESGVFAYHYDSTGTDDGSEVIEPDSGSGRWIKVIGGDSYTDEAAVDAVATALVQGSNITITYDDPNNTITISGQAGYTDEEARDALANALVAGTNVSIVVDDAGDTITISSTDTNTNQLTTWTITDGTTSTVIAHNDTVEFAGTNGISVSESSGVITIDGSGVSGGVSSITIGAEGTPSGDGSIAWNSGTETLTYTPPDLSLLGSDNLGDHTATQDLDMSNYNVLNSGYIAFNTAVDYDPSEGELVWNSDEKTLDLGQGGATLQIGQEVQVPAVNQTGTAIPNGAAVKATGTTGASGKITVAPMDSSSTGDMPSVFIGIATETIAAGGEGKITTFGKVRGIDTSTYTNGDILWLDPANPGGLTTTQPEAPDLKIAAAYVIYAATAQNGGTIMVRANAGIDLHNNHRVQVANLAGGDLLYWNPVNTRWENTSMNTASSTISLQSDPTTGEPTIDVEPALAAGVYGSTSIGTKIAQITVDSYGRVSNITTGVCTTGDITQLTVSGDSGSFTDTAGSVAFTIAGGTGVTTSVSGSTVTVSAEASAMGTGVLDIGNTTDRSITTTDNIATYYVVKSAGEPGDVAIIAVEEYAEGSMLTIVNKTVASITILSMDKTSTLSAVLTEVTSTGLATATSSMTLASGKAVTYTVDSTGKFLY